MLNFRYGPNFKYEGMLTHSFDRFYVVAKYEIPKVEHLPVHHFYLSSNVQSFEHLKKSFVTIYQAL